MADQHPATVEARSGARYGHRAEPVPGTPKRAGRDRAAAGTELVGAGALQALGHHRGHRATQPAERLEAQLVDHAPRDLEAAPQVGRQEANAAQPDRPADRDPAQAPQWAGQRQEPGPGEADGAQDTPHRVIELELCFGHTREVGAEPGPGGRQLTRLDADQPSQAAVFGVEALDLGWAQRAAEVGVAGDVGVKQGRVDPGVGPGLERRVAPAVITHAAEAAVQLTQPAAGGDRIVAAVDEQRDVIDRAQQPLVRMALELREVAHAGADGRMGDLQQQRIEDREVEPDVGG